MSTSKTDRQHQKLTERPLLPLIAGLSVSSVLSMMIVAIYNMADTYFVSQLGTSASAAVGISFPIMAIIQAIGFTFGTGSGSLISRALGKKDYDSSHKIATSAFVAAVGVGLVVTLGGLLFIDDILGLFGATDTVLPFAREYAGTILFGAPIMSATFVLAQLLRAQGLITQAMIGLTFGGILNVFLDPFFIFTLGMGIRGAALATVLSQLISSAILYGLVHDKSVVRLNLVHLSKTARDYGRIVAIGMPAFFRQGVGSVAIALLNREAALYGDGVVAALSIVGRIYFLSIAIIIGIGQAFQPVVGYNYGAGKIDRVKKAYGITIAMGTGIMLITAVITYLNAEDIIRLFRRDDPAVIAIGALSLRLQCLTMPTQPLLVTTDMLFQSTGRAKLSSFLALTRQGIFFFPAMAVLPQFFGLLGIQLIQPTADVLSAASACIVGVLFLRTLRKVENESI